MSGARGAAPAGSPPPSPAGGPMGGAPCMFAPSSTSAVGADGLPRAPKRWPTTSAVRETSARAATAQGSALANPRDRAAEGAPAGVPQRWQKRAPGVSEAEQVAQVAPPSVVPQLEQKRPEAGAPHAGQRDVLVPSGVGASGEAGGVVIAIKATSRRHPLAAEARRSWEAARRCLRGRLRSDDCRPAARSARPPSRPACPFRTGVRRPPARRRRPAHRARRRSECAGPARAP